MDEASIKTLLETPAWAGLALPDQGIDRHKCTRKVPLEVLCLGMPRTGTLSLKLALQILGYNDCYHMSEYHKNVLDSDMWVDAFNAKHRPAISKPFTREDWDKLLGHCAAVTDIPSICFGPELIKLYPDAKVVLVERDFKKWLESWKPIAEGLWSLTYLAPLDPYWTGRLHATYMRIGNDFYQARNPKEALEKAERMYRQHYETIRKVCPKERLLEYKLGSGWGPLCTFLGKPVPKNVDFPWVNERNTIVHALKLLINRVLGRVLFNVGVVGGIIAAIVAIVWQMSRK